MTVLYDCAIIGGGLGGLTLSINLANRGFSVILFEKEKYPFHKVCGEYISNESREYLISLGLPVNEMELPDIRNLSVSSPAGNVFSRGLDSGGFGISRYKIDNHLKEIALRVSVTVKDGTKVDHICFKDDEFIIQTNSGIFRSRVCCGSFGKRSNLDVKLHRSFVRQRPNALNNFIAVKYHARLQSDAGTISLHNFKDGYCGMSQVEDGITCICYLTTAGNLRNYGNSIEKMEQGLLSANPHLKKIFSQASKLYETPVTISQVSFEKKTTVEDHILMIGDAAGLIAPLCGNGMSSAMHSGKIAAENIERFLRGHISRGQMEEEYAENWKKMFGRRLRTGRIIQRFFGKKWQTSMFIHCMKAFPKLADWIIRQTHGRSF